MPHNIVRVCMPSPCLWLGWARPPVGRFVLPSAWCLLSACLRRGEDAARFWVRSGGVLHWHSKPGPNDASGECSLWAPVYRQNELLLVLLVLLVLEVLVAVVVAIVLVSRTSACSWAGVRTGFGYAG